MRYGYIIIFYDTPRWGAENTEIKTFRRESTEGSLFYAASSQDLSITLHDKNSAVLNSDSPTY